MCVLFLYRLLQIKYKLELAETMFDFIVLALIEGHTTVNPHVDSSHLILTNMNFRIIRTLAVCFPHKVSFELLNNAPESVR